MPRRIPKPKKPVAEISGGVNPKQAQFLASRTRYTAYGGARGGGKSHAVRLKALLGALSWPGIRILIIRRTYPELENSIIQPMLREVPQGLMVYQVNMKLMYFPANGATIKFGHYQNASSSQEYQGQEYDWIFMDEATQFTENEFRTLGACLRGVNEIPKRFYLTCNPGGVGHNWVKRLFVDRKFVTDKDNPEENENPEDYSFIRATVEDNTHLMKADPEYVKMLSQQPENIRAAHRYGDWDALAGSYFSEFSEALHVIDPFPIPPGWIRYRAFDYGLDMLACYWIAVDFDGRCYVYRELRLANNIISDAARAINDYTSPGEYISITFAPPDMWARRSDTGKTAAEGFMQHGIGLARADNNRVQGWLQIKELLSGLSDGRPGMLFFRSCPAIISDLQSIQVDDKNPSDCAKQPHDITHGPDAIRYFAQSRTLPSMMPDPGDDYDDDDDYAQPYDYFMTGGEATDSYLYY